MNIKLLLKKVRLNKLPEQPEEILSCEFCRDDMVLIDCSRNGDRFVCDRCNRGVYIACEGNFGP